MNVNLDNLVEVNEDGNVLAGLVEDNGKKYLVLVIDSTKDLGLSSTGKMHTIANSGGFKPIVGKMTGNVYIGRKA